MKIGFTYYDGPAPLPTTSEILAAMTPQQKVGVLNSFIAGLDITTASVNIGIPKAAVKHLYIKIKEVEGMASQLMNSQNQPAGAQELLEEMQSNFSDDFTPSQVEVILTSVVKYSKRDGSGTWIYYRTAVIQT